MEIAFIEIFLSAAHQNEWLLIAYKITVQTLRRPRMRHEHKISISKRFKCQTFIYILCNI